MTIEREHWWDRSAGEGRELFPGEHHATAESAHVEHVERFLQLHRERRKGPADQEQAGEELYLVDDTGSHVREVVGFKLRGHPMAVLGAIAFPSHAASPVAHGRPSLAWFFSKPPTQTPRQGTAPPPGSLEVFMPYVDETVPEMIERVRRDPSTKGVQVDVELIDYAFDLRFRNPSVIPQQGAQADAPQRRVLRTTDGHVLSGVSSGLYKALRKGLRFVTLTDAMQHRQTGGVQLPTLAINRSILAVETLAEGEDASGGTRHLFFHPRDANATHFLGRPYDVAFHGTDQAEQGSGGDGGDGGDAGDGPRARREGGPERL